LYLVIALLIKIVYVCKVTKNLFLFTKIFMAHITDDISRTFDEYLILPGLTKKEHVPSNVSLTAPVSKYFPKSSLSQVTLNIPIVSAAMQSVSGINLGIALARKGGASFIYCSQSIEAQAEMVKKVKEHKAGFVESDSNLSPNATLKDAVALRTRTGHSTIAITENGGRKTKLLGLLTSKDFWEFKDDLSRSVAEHFTPVEKLVKASTGTSLQDATELLWQHKKECLPIVDHEGNLDSLVFRKDYFDHKSNPYELTDAKKRLVVGAAINTHDFKERAKALIEAGVDMLCLDSSDGHSEWQAEASTFIKKEFGENVIVGGGNVVTREGFDYLVTVGKLDFIKVGIGGGSICITRGQKGIGRGQASALLEVAEARNKYYKETGVYVPLCSDGGLNNDSQILIALAMGADFIMMGKYFAMTDESPTEKFEYSGKLYKPYWGEGSIRARNWQRYTKSDTSGLVFEEGVDAYVPYSGPLADKLSTTVSKIKSTFCNIGALTIREFQEKAVLTRVSEMTLKEGGTSTVEQFRGMQELTN
jgi:IMP dehydrogenase